MVCRVQPGEEAVPGYRLLALLGKGTFGEVWRAIGPGGTESALKLIPLNADSGLKELRTLNWIKNIKHPHLMPITGLWLLDKSGAVLDDAALERSDPGAELNDSSVPVMLVVAMLVADKSLMDLHKEYQLQRQAGIPVEYLLNYFEEAAKGLDFLNEPRHQIGRGQASIQHRDVKPENLLLMGGSTVVGDFGVARMLDTQSLTATSMVGSPAYMAPECINGDQIARSTDQYSLALSYYYLRAGTLPFPANANYFAVINCHINGQLDLSRVGPTEQMVLRRASALNPRDRFATCTEMVRTLRSAVSESAESLPSSAVIPPPPTQAVNDTNYHPLDTPPEVNGGPPPIADRDAQPRAQPRNSPSARVPPPRTQPPAEEAKQPPARRSVPPKETAKEKGKKSDSKRLGSLTMDHAAKDYLRLLLNKKVVSNALQAAWDDFYQVYSDMIRRVVLARGATNSDVNEYVREVWAMIAAHLVAHEDAPQTQVRSWLLRLIQQNTNELLVRKSEQAITQSAAEAVGFNFSKPAGEVWAEALFESVLAAVRRKVDDLDYRILHLQFISQYSAERVAEMTQMPVEQIRFRYFRMVRKLEVGMALFTGLPFGSLHSPDRQAPEQS